MRPPPLRPHLAALAGSEILALFLASRLAFLLLTYLAPALFHDPALTHAIHPQPPANPFAPWFYRDSQWFQSIVQHGYSYHGPGRVANVAFFPAYPLAIKLCTLLSPANSAIAAMLIANAAFLATLYLLRALCRATAGEATAQRAILYITVFPTAFYSYAPYSESLYLLASTACLLALHRRRWRAAGACGALAAATRVLGIFLLLAFAVEYLRAHGRRALHPTLLAAALIPAALAAYLLFLAHLTGDPLAFVKAEAGWHRTATWPWQTLASSLADIPSAARQGTYLQAHAILETTLLLACTAALLAALPLQPASSSLYALACIAFLLTAPVTTSQIPITSMSRYLFALAPLPIALARLGRLPACHALYLTLATGSLTLLASFTLCHMWGA